MESLENKKLSNSDIKPFKTVISKKNGTTLEFYKDLQEIEESEKKEEKFEFPYSITYVDWDFEKNEPDVLKVGSYQKILNKSGQPYHCRICGKLVIRLADDMYGRREYEDFGFKTNFNLKFIKENGYINDADLHKPHTSTKKKKKKKKPSKKRRGLL